MSREKSKEGERTMKTETKTVTEKARDIAEFKGVRRAKIIADFSGRANLEVVNPHPELVYRAVRPDKVQRYEQRGYRTAPPDASGKPAKFLGPSDNLVMMAIHRDLHRELVKAKNKAIEAKRAIRSKKRKPFKNLEPVAGSSKALYGDEIRTTRETVEPRKE